MALINFSDNIESKTNIIKEGFLADNQSQITDLSHKDNNTLKENNDSDLSFKNLESDIDSNETQLNELEKPIIEKEKPIIEKENNIKEIEPDSLENDTLIKNYDVDINEEQTPSFNKKIYDGN